MTAMFRICALSLCIAGTACSKPEPPEKEQPPEPQAQRAAQMRDTQLRDAIQAPIQKAQGVEVQVLDAAQQQREAIDAAGG